MTKNQVKKTYQSELQKIVETLKLGRPEKIILFGSAAKGDFKEGSDIDLLIIKNSSLDKIRRAVEIEKSLSDRRLPIDILVYTPSEIEESLKIRGSFAENILKNGKVLYEA